MNHEAIYFMALLFLGLELCKKNHFSFEATKKFKEIKFFFHFIMTNPEFEKKKKHLLLQTHFPQALVYCLPSIIFRKKSHIFSVKQVNRQTQGMNGLTDGPHSKQNIQEKQHKVDGFKVNLHASTFHLN